MSDRPEPGRTPDYGPKLSTTAGKIREVADGVFVVHLPLPMRPTIVNVTLLRSNGEWALIDTGVNSDDSANALQAALAEVGCEPRQVTRIICTHHHPDHFGSSRRYKELFGAKVYLHRKEAESSKAYATGKRSEEAVAFFLRHGIPLQRFVHVPSPAQFWAGLYVPVEPDGFIDDGDILQVGNCDIEVVATPGHTPGHCVLYLRSQKILIAGDHLLPKITPHVGVFPGGPENPLRDFIASQKKIQALDVGLVLPAHGGVFNDHRHRARQIIQHHECRMQEMLDIVRQRPRTAYDVARIAFDFNVESSLTVQFPATFETLAHLELLRSEGRLGRVDAAEETLFQAA
jgi:glyoxylase-like metal-dependent hydrolase (beta-lactamase superfamily II)